MRTLPHDPALDGLADVLPAERVPDFVAETAAQLAGVEVGPGEVRYVRYRPLKSCVVLWSFPGPTGRVLLSGKLFASGAGARTVDRTSFRNLAATVQAATEPRRLPYRYLPESRLLLQLFPLDLRLPGLSLALSPAWVGHALSAALVDAEPLSYKPWRRCVVRYRGGRAAYVGKVFRDDRGEAIARGVSVVARQLGAADAWRVREPAAYLPQARLLLFESLANGLEGASVFRAAARRSAREAALRELATRAAAGLPAFRRAAMPGLRRRDPETVLAWLHRSAGALDAVAPKAARRIDEALYRLARESDRLPPERTALCHGAFRHDQLLVHGDELFILDLDELHAGGAGADPGNFLAYLDATALRRPKLEPAARECQRAFLEELETQPSVDPHWLAWHRSTARVKYALRSVFSLAPRWPEQVEALLPARHAPITAALGGG